MYNQRGASGCDGARDVVRLVAGVDPLRAIALDGRLGCGPLGRGLV